MIGCVTATDDFIPQEEVDLGFRRGVSIELLNLIDENWGEGRLGGRIGIFPLIFTNYADLRDIPEQRPPSPNKKRSGDPNGVQGIIKNVKHGNLEVGDVVNILSRDNNVFWVEDRGNNIIPVATSMVELKPKIALRTSKTSKIDKKLKRASWSPEKSPNELEVANLSFDDGNLSMSPQKDKRERPKSVADVLTDSTTKRRSYQEATEGVGERKIIEKIVDKDIRRDQPGRKSLKDLLRGRFTSESSKKDSEKHLSRIRDQIERQEKEKRRLEERFSNASETDRTTLRNQISMAESNLRRLHTELTKDAPVSYISHQRTPSAPVSMASSEESSQSKGEIQLQKAIEELKETEYDFVNDIWFILSRLEPEIEQDRDLLFGGLADIHEFASHLAIQFCAIDARENPEEQCEEIAKLFLDEIVDMRNVYGPYCSRQSEATVKAAQLNTAEIDGMISAARKKGETKAFNMNSLLIKPVQRITRYPLLLGQIAKYAPSESAKLKLGDAFNVMKGILDEINNQKMNFDIVDRYTRQVPRQPNIMNGLINGFKSQLKPTQPNLDDPNDKIFNKEYQIATNVKTRIERFLEELKKLTPIVRAMCPESVLGAEFDQTIRMTIFFPLQEVFKCFEMPDTLVRKRSAKLNEYERLSKSDSRAAHEAKQVFSALNAQLMAELPKLSAFAESLFLSSVASLTYLVGQFMKKLNSQHPRSSSDNNAAARQKFTKSNTELWLAIQQLDLVSTNFNRPKPEPFLTSSTQSLQERKVIEGTNGYTFEAKSRWVSGDRKDLKVSKGDLLQKVNDQLVGGKMLVYNGRNTGYVPITIVNQLVNRKSSSGLPSANTTSTELISFEAPPIDFPAGSSPNSLYVHAKFDFKARSNAELTVGENEQVLIVSQSDADGNSDWWLVQNLAGHEGYVPKAYLVDDS